MSYPKWDVTLVDQSDNDRTLRVAEAFSEALPNLKYVHSRQKGTALARNLGAEASTGTIIAFLDDDCTARADWLAQVASAFDRYAVAAIVFGGVIAAPHDPSRFYIPIYHVGKESLMKSPFAFSRPDGAGASMSWRRASAARVGRMDTNLGPGSRYFPGGEDNDYTYRCLAAGYAVVKTASIVVTHHGTKTRADGAACRLLLTNAFCAAAVDMKLLRCRHPVALIVMFSHIAYFLLRFNLRDVVSRRAPTNMKLLATYVRGVRACFIFDVDRRQGLFIDRNALRPVKSYTSQKHSGQGLPSDSR